jgi:hypothetical protein
VLLSIPVMSVEHMVFAVVQDAYNYMLIIMKMAECSTVIVTTFPQASFCKSGVPTSYRTFQKISQLV